MSYTVFSVLFPLALVVVFVQLRCLLLPDLSSAQLFLLSCGCGVCVVCAVLELTWIVLPGSLLRYHVKFHCSNCQSPLLSLPDCVCPQLSLPNCVITRAVLFSLSGSIVRRLKALIQASYTNTIVCALCTWYTNKNPEKFTKSGISSRNRVISPSILHVISRPTMAQAQGLHCHLIVSRGKLDLQRAAPLTLGFLKCRNH